MSSRELLAQALGVWPDFGVEEDFLRRLEAGILEPQAADAFVPADFYLACAAQKGVPGAVKALRALLDAQVRFLPRFELDAAQVDDLLASTLEKLLVPGPDAPPKLTRYLGRGSLTSW